MEVELVRCLTITRIGGEDMSATTQRIGNLCVWCAAAAIAVLTAVTAGVLVWVVLI